MECHLVIDLINPSNSFTVNSIDQMSCFPIDVVGCWIAGRYSGIVVKVAAGTVQQELCENGVDAANLVYVDV